MSNPSTSVSPVVVSSPTQTVTAMNGYDYSRVKGANLHATIIQRQWRKKQAEKRIVQTRPVEIKPQVNNGVSEKAIEPQRKSRKRKWFSFFSCWGTSQSPSPDDNQEAKPVPTWWGDRIDESIKSKDDGGLQLWLKTTDPRFNPVRERKKAKWLAQQPRKTNRVHPLHPLHPLCPHEEDLTSKNIPDPHAGSPEKMQELHALWSTSHINRSKFKRSDDDDDDDDDDDSYHGQRPPSKAYNAWGTPTMNSLIRSASSQRSGLGPKSLGKPKRPLMWDDDDDDDSRSNASSTVDANTDYKNMLIREKMKKKGEALIAGKTAPHTQATANILNIRPGSPLARAHTPTHSTHTKTTTQRSPSHPPRSHRHSPSSSPRLQRSVHSRSSRHDDDDDADNDDDDASDTGTHNSARSTRSALSVPTADKQQRSPSSPLTLRALETHAHTHAHTHARPHSPSSRSQTHSPDLTSRPPPPPPRSSRGDRRSKSTPLHHNNNNNNRSSSNSNNNNNSNTRDRNNHDQHDGGHVEHDYNYTRKPNATMTHENVANVLRNSKFEEHVPKILRLQVERTPTKDRRKQTHDDYFANN